MRKVGDTGFSYDDADDGAGVTVTCGRCHRALTLGKKLPAVSVLATMIKFVYDHTRVVLRDGRLVEECR